MTPSNGQALNLKHILLNSLRSKHGPGNEIWLVYVILQQNLLSKYCMKNVSQKLVPGSLIFKEISIKKNLRRSVC